MNKYSLNVRLVQSYTKKIVAAFQLFLQKAKKTLQAILRRAPFLRKRFPPGELSQDARQALPVVIAAFIPLLSNLTAGPLFNWN